MEALVLILTGILAVGIIARHIYRSVKTGNGCYKCEGCAARTFHIPPKQEEFFWKYSDNEYH